MTGRPDDVVVENRNAGQVSNFAQSRGQLGRTVTLCGIPVLDHVVVAATGHVSLADRGWR